MGYDKWFEGWNFGFCLIFLGILRLEIRLHFWVSVWNNQLCRCCQNVTIILVLSTPHHIKTMVNRYILSIVFTITFEWIDVVFKTIWDCIDIIIWHSLKLCFIVYHSFWLYQTIYNKIIKTCWQSYKHMIKYRQVKNEPQKTTD